MHFLYIFCTIYQYYCLLLHDILYYCIALTKSKYCIDLNTMTHILSKSPMIFCHFIRRASL